eukprot:5183564-Amphidinium_carterae.1
MSVCKRPNGPVAAHDPTGQIAVANPHGRNPLDQCSAAKQKAAASDPMVMFSAARSSKLLNKRLLLATL